MSTQLFSENFSQRIAIAGLLIYVAFAPHSVAASVIGVAIAGIGWVIRATQTRSLGLSRSKFDLLIVLLLVWTGLSSLLSEEPSISIAKLTSQWTVFLFYLTRAVITRRSALLMVSVLILSGCVGALYSAFDLIRGRGVVVESIAARSPFQRVGVLAGDTVWRVGGRRVYSLPEIDEALRSAPANTPLRVSIISQGEHAERPGLVLTASEQQAVSPSGLTGSLRSHRFRASGGTRHYETFAEVLQIIAQLALGFALAHLRNHGPNKYFRIALAAAALLVLGLAFTAMRTVIVAFAIGACVVAWRSLRGAYKLAFIVGLFFVIGLGVVVVSQTRARDALALGDPSSMLRFQVARVGMSRIPEHPVFGHGMDAMKRHWTEWGFPGKDMLHLHSTPLQLAFDRGLPLLVLWLWLMALFWTEIAGAEKRAADLSDTHVYGILLGGLGALSGFLASSVVNYNFGDSEAVMLFWWLMGVCVFSSGQSRSLVRSGP